MSVWLNSTFALTGLVIGLAGFVWLAQKRFESAIYLIIFLLPFYLLKIKIFFIPTNVLEILIGLLFLLWLAKKKYKDIGLSDIREFSLPALLILNGAILSTLFSQNLAVSAGILKSWFVIPLIFALIISQEIKSGQQVKKIFRWLTISGGLVALIGILYFLDGKVTFDGRLSAFFLSPNHLAMYLAPGFLAGLVLFDSGVKKEKLIFFAIVVALGLALYLTFSYAAWAAIIISTLFWLFIRIKNKKKVAIIYGLLFLTLVGILFVSQLKSEKLESFLHSARSSWQSRLMIWRSAWAIAKDHPLFGSGPGMFQDYYLKYQSRFAVPYLEWAVPQPHNLWLAFWLQTGLLGLIGFLWLIILFFRKIKQAAVTFSCCGTHRPSASSNSPRCENATAACFCLEHRLLMTLAALMIYSLLHGLIDTTYFKNDLAVVFWLIIALVVSLRSVRKTQAV